jgi:hypothetical protein
MISKHDLERLLNRPEGEHPVLSLFLDMSVNSDNKRTHQVFLNQRRAQFDELDSDRENRHREAIGRPSRRSTELAGRGVRRGEPRRGDLRSRSAATGSRRCSSPSR